MSTHTRSRIGLVFSARIQVNTFGNTERVNNVEVPQLVLSPLTATDPRGTPGTRTLGMSLRQSRIGAAVSVDSVLGARFEGDVDFDFFGGVSNGPGDRRLFPEPRLRVARAQLTWVRTELLVGSETPLISDLNPMSAAAVGVPEFVAAGNLWNWLPQVRVTREIVGPTSRMPVRVALQAAALAPYSNAQNVAETDAVDAAERSGRPFLESRVRVRWGTLEDGTLDDDGETLARGGEIGISTHYGWLRASGQGMQHSRAVAADAHVALPAGLELRGEVYSGQLVRGLGGGAIAQNFGRAVDSTGIGPSLRDVAGWLQVNARLHPTLVAGVGCGSDAVNLRDRPVRQRNTTCAMHAFYRPNQPLFIAIEMRGLQTRYAERNYRGSHFNLAMGFEL